MQNVKLTELEPRWITAPDPQARSMGKSDSFQTAQGIRFLCPKCLLDKKAGKENVCAHCIVIWFANRNVPDSYFPGPYRWNAIGSSFEDLTLSPSIDLTPRPQQIPEGAPKGCCWHGWIQNGFATHVS